MQTDPAIPTDVKPEPIRFTIPIAKVDKQKRLVRGVATAEVVDAHGQIVDYETAKAVFGEWVGNIREMHQPKAVGKRTAVEFDDDNRQIILESYISKGAADTWEKVLDGTLSMYSIGGEGEIITDKVAPNGRILMSGLAETSLVDNGACPVAKFDIVKAVDGLSTDVQPEEPAEAAKPVIARGALIAALATAATTLTKAPKAAALALAKKTALDTETAVRKGYPEVYDINAALTAIACLESLLASEWWEAHDEAVAGEIDGAQTARAQLELLRQAVNLVLAFLVSEFDEQFTEFDEADAAASGTTDLAGVMNVRTARIARLAESVAAFSAVLPIVFGKLDGSGQLWIAKAGARHSKNDIQMIQNMHDTSLTLGAACKAADGDACKAQITTQTTVKMCEPCREAHARAAAAQPREVAPSVTEVVPDVAPVPAAAVVAAPIKAADPVVPVVEPVPAAGTPADMQAIVKAAVAEAIAATKATSDQAIAELRTQVEKLSHEPVPGGPKARATTEVHKSIGNLPSDTAALDPAQVHAFAQELAKNATTEEERLRIAQGLLRFQHATGAGAVAYQSNTGRKPMTAADGDVPSK